MGEKGEESPHETCCRKMISEISHPNFLFETSRPVLSRTSMFYCTRAASPHQIEPLMRP